MLHLNEMQFWTRDSGEDDVINLQGEKVDKALYWHCLKRFWVHYIRVILGKVFMALDYISA